MAERPLNRASSWVQALSIIALVALAFFDITNKESVPLIVYGIIGGIALGVDSESIPGIFGGKR